MLKRIVVCLLVAGAMAACNTERNEAAWKLKADSLQSELALHREAMQTLDEVGVLIDSIDASRDLLRTDIVEGLPHDSFSARLSEINNYVKASKMKIEDLEKAIKNNSASSRNMKAVVAKLKQDLKLKGEEIAFLTAEVGRYKSENENLTNSLTIQSAELNDKLEQLTAKQEEVAKLEGQVKEMLAQANYDMAESYYLRAQALEEAAKRTNFAPKKKKSTKKEALELYKLAALSGKQEAEAKIKELEN
jgi:small-conductance mechanosensitive channel